DAARLPAGRGVEARQEMIPDLPGLLRFEYGPCRRQGRQALPASAFDIDASLRAEPRAAFETVRRLRKDPASEGGIQESDIEGLLPGTRQEMQGIGVLDARRAGARGAGPPLGQAGAELARRGPVPFDEGHMCRAARRSEEHTSELQSRQYLVCRLLLEKKKK